MGMRKNPVWVKYLFIIILLGNAFHLFSQNRELRIIYQETIHFNEKWSLLSDGGLYQGLKDAEWTRWGIRGSMTYKKSDRISLDGGLMINHVNKYGNGNEIEFRPHQSFRFLYPILPRMSFRHRLRVEERIFIYPPEGNSDFNTRLRYRVSTRWGINKRVIYPKTLYGLASAEFNVNLFGDKSDFGFFQRGRYGMGLGYQISTALSLEGTYFYQLTRTGLTETEEDKLGIFQIALKHTLRIIKY
ncbi:DUF2490 domain-containing protein [Marinilabiliaceae bacterium JC017]|nr:DUF2490 domain-containing protein [Marinilabiliaceae bacterium JC017]